MQNSFASRLRRSTVAVLCMLVVSACVSERVETGATAWSYPATGVPAPVPNSGAAPGPVTPGGTYRYPGLEERRAIEMERAAKRAEIRRLEQRQFSLRRRADSAGRVGRWLSPRVDGVDRFRYNALSDRIEKLERELRTGR